MDKEILNEKYEKYKETFYNKDKTYSLKRIMSYSEREMFNKLNEIYKNQYYIFPQVCLSAFIDTPKGQERKELYRHPDFVICDLEFNPIAVIELNGKTHNAPYSKLRDTSVKFILNDCNIPLIQISIKNPSNHTLKEIIDRSLNNHKNTEDNNEQ